MISDSKAFFTELLDSDLTTRKHGYSGAWERQAVPEAKTFTRYRVKISFNEDVAAMTDLLNKHNASYSMLSRKWDSGGALFTFGWRHLTDDGYGGAMAWRVARLRAATHSN
jgi:hypothetical protein